MAGVVDVKHKRRSSKQFSEFVENESKDAMKIIGWIEISCRHWYNITVEFFSIIVYVVFPWMSATGYCLRTRNYQG